MANVSEYEVGAPTAISVWFTGFCGSEFSIKASDNRRPPANPSSDHTVLEIEANYGKPHVSLHLSDAQLETLRDVVGARLEWITARCPECLTGRPAEPGVPCESCQANLAEEQGRYELRCPNAEVPS